LLIYQPDQKAPSGWSKRPRQFLPGCLYIAIEDFDSYTYQTISSFPIEKMTIGSTLSLIYEVYQNETFTPLVWLRVYYMNQKLYGASKFENDFPILYQDVLLPGIGPLETISLSNGTVTFSRNGDPSLFWSGTIPKPICLYEITYLNCSIEKEGQLEYLVQGPPASQYFSSRSKFASEGLSSISFSRLDSINDPSLFSILLASLKLGEDKYMAEVKSWSYNNLNFHNEQDDSNSEVRTSSFVSPLRSFNSGNLNSFIKYRSFTWAKKNLLQMKIPIHLTAYGNLIENIAQNTLLGSLTDHFISHSFMPQPSFVNLSGEKLIIFPYKNIATLIKYCSVSEKFDYTVFETSLFRQNI